MKIAHLAAAVCALSAAEAALILAGALPPVLSYSIGNIAFSLGKLAIIAYAGASYASSGLKKNASDGAVLGFAGAAALEILSLLGSAAFGKAILGLPPVPDAASLIVLLSATLLFNSILGAAVAAVAGLAIGAMGRKGSGKAPGSRKSSHS